MQLDPATSFLSFAIGRLGAAYTRGLSAAVRTRYGVRPFHEARLEPSCQRQDVGIFGAERLERRSSKQIIFLGC